MEENNNANNQIQPIQGESKTGIGVVCGIFLGLIGLIVGICSFKEGTYERKTFIKGWAIAFGVTAGIEIILSVLLVVFVGVGGLLS